jgi:GMP synthase-like glutamine amidotransferase
MNLRVAILRTDDVRSELVETFGEYPEMFEALLSDANRRRPIDQQVILKMTTYRANQAIYPANVDDYDAYIITGSKSGVYEDLAWIHLLGDFVRALHQRKKKLIGICFGHQLVANVLGGKACQASSGWEIGVKDTRLKPEYTDDFSGNESFKLLYSHQDQVVQPATGAKILASTMGCPIAMTAVDQHILTFQGHPEFPVAYASALYQLRKDVYPKDCYSDAMDSLNSDTDHLNVANWMIDFIAS